MNQSFFLRQLDIADPSQFKNKPITVIGDNVPPPLGVLTWNTTQTTH